MILRCVLHASTPLYWCKNRSRIQKRGLTSFNILFGVLGDRLLVMGATNLPMDLDDAALRRFTKRIEIQMPDFDARKAMIRHLLRRVFVSLPVEEMDEIAEWVIVLPCPPADTMPCHALLPLGE